MPYFVVVKETEDEGERKCTGEGGQGYLSCRDEGLPLERDQADVAHRFIKVKGETPYQDEVFDFNQAYFLDEPKGASYCWDSVL